MNRDEVITALNLLTDLRDEPLPPQVRSIARRALEDRLPDSDSMAGVRTPVGPALLVLAGDGLFIVTDVVVEGDDVGGGHGVRIERVELSVEGTAVSVTEHYQGTVDTTIVRRWSFGLGSRPPLRFETRQYPNGYSPADEFANHLAGRLGWSV